MAKRKAVGFLMAEKRLSERRACRIVGLARSEQQYRPAPKNDEAVVARMKALASENRRYGYLSYRVATRRQSFSLPNMISMRLRLL